MTEGSIASEPAGIADGRWAGYDRWNEVLADEFFAGRYGGRPVYLDLEPESMERIAASAGVASRDVEQHLIDAVRPTLLMRERGPLFGLHHARIPGWTSGSREQPPPIVAVLAFLSLVAERMRSDGEFHASNYYGRFIQMLDDDPRDHSLRQKVVRGFADGSHFLWSLLNDWLEDDPGSRGYPTAYAFDYRVHVGRPMSQALVRERDREGLREMFLDLRLPPRHEMARADMKRLLADWLPDAPISAHLKGMCETEEVLERVADVACVELRAWDGRMAMTDDAVQRGQLALVGSLQRLPRPRLRLGVAVRLAGSEEHTLTLRSGSSEGASAALVDVGGRLAVESADEDGWREVRDGSRIRVADLLVSQVSLECDGVHVRRAPRRLVLLERDEGRLRYVEVERARLGVEYLILATEALLPLLEPVLEQCAREGYRKLEGERLLGVPSGWIAFSGVELIAITEAQHTDLTSLVPVAWTQLSFGGGLVLPARQTWHSRMPPEVRASSAATDEVVVRLVTEGSGRGGSTTSTSSGEESDDLGRFVGAGAFPLDAANLPNGNYRVALLEDPADSKTLTSSVLRLRSADSAGPTTGEELSLAHDPRAGAIFALSAAGDNGVRGALLPADFEDSEEEKASVPAAGLDDFAVEAEEEAEGDRAEEEPTLREPKRSVPFPNCMETGAHRFDLDLETRTRPAAWGESGGVCIHCGMEKFWPARLGGRHRSSASVTERLERAAVARPDVAPRPSDPELDLDVVLDALSYLGAGRWETLARVVGQLDDSPWSPLRVGRVFSALGHIDISRSVRDLRPDRWSIAPSTLVVTEGDTFLCGWRSDGLLDALNRSVAQHRGTMRNESLENGPARIAVADVAPHEIEEIAVQVSQEVGRPVATARGVPARLAAALPRLDAIRQTLPAMEWPPDQDLDLFDVGTGAWVTPTGPIVAGGYRTRRLPRRFWHFDGQDWRPADSRTVKWFAAFGRRPLLAWNAETGSLACHVGCEPPGLFERAASLCSGRRPRSVRGEVVYEDVDEAVASALTARLGRK